MADRLQIRRDTADNWTEANPILAQGEWGYELDFNRLKIGDGILPWVDLPYFAGGGSGYVMKDLFEYDSTTTFTLSDTPSDIIAVDLRGQVLDGVSGLAWELDGDDITILYDLQAGDSIQVIYTVGSIGGSAVTTAQAQSIAASLVNAQKDQEGGIAANDTAILNLDTVDDFSTVQRKGRSRFYVNDPIRGGMFSFYPTSAGLTVDNGVVFAVSGGFAVRKFDGPVRSPWFGIVADYDPETGEGTDNAAQLKNLFSYEDVELEFGNYLAGANFGPSFSSRDTFKVDGRGAVIFIAERPSLVNNNLLGTTTLAANTTLSQVHISVASVPVGLKKGDLVLMQSDAFWYYENRGEAVKGGTNEVVDISGTTIRMKYPVDDFYDISLETVEITFYSRKTLDIRNLSIKRIDRAGIGCFQINRFSAVTLHNFNLFFNDTSGLRLEKCIDVTYTGSMIDLDIPADYSLGTAYGIQVRDCTNVKAIGMNFYNCRRGLDFNGNYPSRYGGVFASTVVSMRYALSSGLGSHGPSDHIQFIGNTIVVRSNGIRVRGGNHFIANNTFSYCESCVYISAGNSAKIVDNAIEEVPQLYKNVPAFASQPQRLVLVANLNDATQIDGEYLLTIMGNKGSIRGEAIREQTSDLKPIRYDVSNNTLNVYPQVTSVENRFLYTDSVGRTLANANFTGNKITNFGVVSYHYPFFAGHYVLDFNTCTIDQFTLPASYIKKFGGAGDLSNLESFVNVSCDTKTVKLSGVIRVDVITDTASVRIGEFLPKQLSRDMFYELMGTNGAVKHVAQFQRVGQARTGYLHISPPSDASPIALWPVGSYQITLNLELVLNGSHAILAQ